MKFFLLFFFLITNFTSIAETNTAKSSCNLSGTESIQEDTFGLSFSFGSKYRDIAEKISQTISEYKTNHCPKSCNQINQFKVSSSILPKKSKPNSCNKKDEKYLIKKEFKPSNEISQNKSKKEQLIGSHASLNTWFISTFLTPYIPFSLDGKKYKNSEEHEKILKKACPKCSFYIYYDYHVTKNNDILADINVQCGDSRIMFFADSSYSGRYSLTNNWKCQAK